MTHKLGAMAVAMVLMTAQAAFADDAAAPSPPGPLAPGPAAGVQNAENGPNINKLVIVAGLGLGALAIYLVVGTHYHVQPQKSSSGTK